MDHWLVSLILQIADFLGSKAFKCASLFGAAPGIWAADGSSALLWNTRGWSPPVFWDRGQRCHWSQGEKDWWWLTDWPELLTTKTPCFVMSKKENLCCTKREMFRISEEASTGSARNADKLCPSAWKNNGRSPLGKKGDVQLHEPYLCSEALCIQVDMIFPDEISTQRLSALWTAPTALVRFGALNPREHLKLGIFRASR